MRATLAALLLTLTTAASARPTLVIQPHAPTTTFNTTVEAVCRSRTCTTQNDTSVDHAALRGGEYEAVIVQTTPAARSLADHAAQSGTPVVRVVTAVTDVHAAFERPAVIVVPSVRDLPRGWPGPLHAVETVSAQDGQLQQVLDAVLATPLPSAFTCAPHHLLTPHTHPPPPPRPPLGLAMIVRNEASSIAQTAASAAPHIDAWTIVDTGSTDATVSAIKGSALATSVPGNLTSAPFVDFAVTRNEALRRHGSKTAYVFMPDAEFGFVGLWRLRLMAARLEAECREFSHDACIAGLKITRSTPGVDVGMVVGFPTTTAIGTSSGWHYRYPVHEVSSFADTYHRHVIDVPRYVRMASLEGVAVGSKSPRRWLEFDLPVLRKAVQETPNDTRVVFYLARTLQAVNLTDEALTVYARRAAMGGWPQEVFYSHYERGRILADTDGADPTDALMAAATVDPDRTEPLTMLSMWHDRQVAACDARHTHPTAVAACKMSHRAAGYTYAKQAVQRAGKLPTGKLFVLTSMYEWGAELQLSLHAWWLAHGSAGACGEGRRLADSLAARYPGKSPFDGNQKFYAELAGRLGEGMCGA